MTKRPFLFMILLLGGLSVSSLRGQVADLRGGPLGIERVAAKANYAVYESAHKTSPDDSCWIEIDLGEPHSVDAVKLFPVVWDSWDRYARPGFPVRFRIEVSGSPDYSYRKTIADHTGSDYTAAAVDQVDIFRPASPVTGQYVRLTVTGLPKRHDGYFFDLWRLEVWSGGRNIAENRTLTDSEQGSLGKHPLLIKGAAADGGSRRTGLP